MRRQISLGNILLAGALFLPGVVSAQGAVCNLIDTNTQIPQAFATPYDVVAGTGVLLLSASCTNNAVTVTAGTGAQNQYIFQYGYEWRGGTWERFSFEPAGAAAGPWLIGNATATFPRSAQDMRQNNFVVAYVCQWHQGRWYCGCGDAQCASPRWQLQAFRTEGSGGVAGVPNIILDTDLSSDCDDAGALAVLHALTDNGEANILAMVTSAGDRFSVGGLDVINTYYGHPDLPVGAYMGDHMEDCSDNRQCPYNGVLTREYESDVKHRGQADDAVDVYRRSLAAAPDGSVTIVTIGFLTNLPALLASGSDEYSELSGTELVRRKVDKLVTMGGYFPSGGNEWNFSKNGAAEFTRVVLEEWPTPIYFSGHDIGGSIMTGERLLAQQPNSNPVRRAYDIWLSSRGHDRRPSYDQTAVLFAVRGAEDLWGVVGPGRTEMRANGSTVFRENADGRHYYITKKKSDSELARIIEDLMLAPPQQ